VDFDLLIFAAVSVVFDLDHVVVRWTRIVPVLADGKSAFTKETYIPAKVRYISAKEPYISTKGLTCGC